MKNVLIVLLAILVIGVVLKDRLLPHIKTVDREILVPDTTLVTEWRIEKQTLQDSIAALNQKIHTFKPQYIRITSAPDTIRQLVRDTISMVEVVNLDYSTFRGRDSVTVFADIYPNVNTVIWRSKWNPDYTKVETKTITQQIIERRRLGYGFQLGAGMSTSGPVGYVGFGINWTIGGL